MKTANFRFQACLLVLTLLVGSGPALGGMVSVGALQDSMIFGTVAGIDTGNASGKGPALFAGADGQGNMKRSLIEFDIGAANIPLGATITGVTMTTGNVTTMIIATMLMTGVMIVTMTVAGTTRIGIKYG